MESLQVFIPLIFILCVCLIIATIGNIYRQIDSVTQLVSDFENGEIAGLKSLVFFTLYTRVGRKRTLQFVQWTSDGFLTKAFKVQGYLMMFIGTGGFIAASIILWTKL